MSFNEGEGRIRELKDNGYIIVCDFCGCNDDDEEGKGLHMVYSARTNTAICSPCVEICNQVIAEARAAKEKEPK